MPAYSGEIQVSGLKDKLDVKFDEFGVPHINASSADDAYRALGYLHAQERLFQMELLRHAGDARLSEVFGADLIAVDIMFCRMGLREYADESILIFNQSAELNIKAELKAYMAGINAFIAEKRLPPEFKLLGNDCAPFTERDAFSIANYMAFSFALGQRTDPLVDWVAQNLGDEYLKNMAVNHYAQEPFIPTQKDSSAMDLSQISAAMAELQSLLPMSAFEGSNSWAVSSKRSSTGYPLFCNDTHMSHGMPSIWYESQLSYPGFSIYGNHIPGIPFALLGHSDHHVWGLTMLEQDDLDFYHETISSDSLQVKYKGEWVNLERRTHQILIKNEGSIEVETLISPHGPLVQDLFNLPANSGAISLWWDFVKHENHLLEVFRDLHHASSLQEFETAVARIHGPGLNVQYADNEDNIAWWACARFIKRPQQYLSKMILDGSSGEYDPTGYYDFSETPKNVNPASGIIYSANDQTGAMHDTLFYPGYYKPHHRGQRILRKLTEKSDWDVESMKTLINDVQSDVDSELLAWMKSQLILENLSDSEKKYVHELAWNGDHTLDSTMPTIYYKWLFHALQNTLEDELGPERFSAFLGTHWMKRAYPLLLKDENSIWWDDINSKEKETLQGVLTYSFQSTIAELQLQFGEDSKNWTWNKARHLELNHPMGKVKPLNYLFNVGPLEIAGGHETISQTGFLLNGEGFYPVLVGPQMRIVHNLADVEDSWSVLPSGQSGHPLSNHYDDQFEMYVNGQFRKQNFTLNTGENVRQLVLVPEN